MANAGISRPVYYPTRAAFVWFVSFFAIMLIAFLWYVLKEAHLAVATLMTTEFAGSFNASYNRNLVDTLFTNAWVWLPLVTIVGVFIWAVNYSLKERRRQLYGP